MNYRLRMTVAAVTLTVMSAMTRSPAHAGRRKAPFSLNLITAGLPRPVAQSIRDNVEDPNASLIRPVLHDGAQGMTLNRGYNHLMQLGQTTTGPTTTTDIRDILTYTLFNQFVAKNSAKGQSTYVTVNKRRALTWLQRIVPSRGSWNPDDTLEWQEHRALAVVPLFGPNGIFDDMHLHVTATLNRPIAITVMDKDGRNFGMQPQSIRAGWPIRWDGMPYKIDQLIEHPAIAKQVSAYLEIE